MADFLFNNVKMRTCIWLLPFHLMMFYLVFFLFILSPAAYASSTPDLIVQFLTKPGSISKAINQPFSVKCIVKNAGSSATPASVLGVRVGGSSTLERFHVSRLNPGQSSKAFEVHARFSRSGRYLITAIADADGIVTESNESNNQRAISIEVGQPEKPDLIIKSITSSTSAPMVDTHVYVTVTVANQSASAESPATQLLFKVGGETHPKIYTVPALAPGKRYSIRRDVSANRPINLLVAAEVDPYNKLSERNEQNNKDTLTLVFAGKKARPPMPGKILSQKIPSRLPKMEGSPSSENAASLQGITGSPSASTPPASAPFSCTRITASRHDQGDPSIYGNYIAWLDFAKKKNPKVMLYNLKARTGTVLEYYGPHSAPVVNEDKVYYSVHWKVEGGLKPYRVWRPTSYDIDNPPKPWWIHRDYEKGHDRMLTDADKGRIVWMRKGKIYLLEYGMQEYLIGTGVDAKISGDKVVYHSITNGRSDVYMYDITTGTTNRITTSGMASWPDIHEDRIVWQEKRNGRWDIYMYDISSGATKRITTSGRASKPAIYGDRIVWQDGRNGNLDIYMYDISNGKETWITSNKANQSEPAIFENRIVWTDFRDGNGDIYACTLK